LGEKVIAEDWRYSNLPRIQGFLAEAEKATDSSKADEQTVASLKKIGKVVVFAGGVVQSSDLNVTKGSANSVAEDHPVLAFNNANVKTQFQVSMDSPDITPIFIVYAGAQACQVNIQVKSQTNIVEMFLLDSEEAQFISVVTSISLSAGAKLHHSVVGNGKTKSRISHFLNVVQHQNSKAQFFNLSLGGEYARYDVRNYLRDPGAQSSLGGLYLKSQSEFVDHCTKVFHEAPRTESSQLYKGVLGGSSRAIFNGIIKIKENCPESKTNQLNRNLIVSKKAEAISRPQLEILTDNVKANHGMTIGNLNPAEIFYLMSRGIPADTAHDMLADAFVNEVTDQFVDAHILSLVKDLISSRWEPMRGEIQ
jgi:Fe-S cluster assembly protein SufD